MNVTNDQIQKIAIKDLAKKILCDGHLFVTSKEGRRFYVLQPGMLVDEDFVKKHASLGTVFDFEPISNREVTENFCRLFRELKYLQFEKDLRTKSVEIVRYFHDVYATEEHFLSFVLACFQEFSLVPLEALKKMHRMDLNLFRKSLYSAAFSIITAITNDFYHYLMLRDFFNLTLSLDMGLVDSHYSYYVAKGCNQENQFPGSGAQWMRGEKASELELKVFLQHPLKSYEFVKAAGFLSFPELAEVVLYQHELSSGNGFPRGTRKGQVSSWEAVVLLASSLVEIEDTFTFEKGVTRFLTEFQNAKLTELPVSRAHHKLCKAFEYFIGLSTGTDG